MGEEWNFDKDIPQWIRIEIAKNFLSSVYTYLLARNELQDTDTTEARTLVYGAMLEIRANEEIECMGEKL